LYVAEKENCHAYAVDSGELVSIFQAPQLLPDRRQDWGYLATVGDHLYGSTNHAGAAFYELSEDTCDLLEGDFRDLILGNALFCKNRHTGETVWTYQKGVLFNSAIAMNDFTLFFVESRNPEAVVDRDGRLSADLFNASETSLIALDRLTGDKRWETPYAFPFQHIMYLSHVDGIVLAVGTYNVGKFVHYGLHAFNAQDGKPIWNSAYQGQEIGGTHGEQWQHPVIIGEQVYSRPYVFNLKTGEKGSYELDRGGHGCGGLSGSARYLYGRGFNPRRYALTNQKESGSPLSLVNRPGCWINMIPAGGLVLLPESSSGCTCSYSMQLSIAYAPIH
ncbi:MAG: hypothetical protein RBU29_17995, partial [bacterium]|nr:hypothetical protein [bacterium]